MDVHREDDWKLRTLSLERSAFPVRPTPGILEHLEPRTGFEVTFPCFRHEAPLPLGKGSFGMRHHNEVSAVGRAQAGDTMGDPLRLKG